ncbi:MAG TPA: TadE family protein [Chloroflexota bacterium]|nr:TadE family protein [Chloroflexota bacterium]
MEFAFVLVMLLMVIVGIVDFGRIYYYDIVVSAAADQGARAARDGLGDNAVKAAAQSSAPSGMIATSAISVSPNCSTRQTNFNAFAPQWTSVTVQYSFSPFTPLARVLVGSTITTQRVVSRWVATAPASCP